MIKIGNKKIPNIIMAPMAGCTDLAFRLMSRKYGAKFCFFEMVETMSLVMKNPQAPKLLKTNSKDKPIAAQLLGNDPQKMLDGAYTLLDMAPDITFLDINSACPVPKVLKRKSGCYLMKTPATLIKIAKLLSDKLPLPITVKIRTGFDKNDTAFLIDLVKRLEDNGISAIFIHGRTCKQKHAGEVDYESIREVKNAVSIPVFGSGHIFSPELAKKMIDETGCDGVMVARGALGNPWIFKDIEHYLKTRNIRKHKDVEKQRIAALKQHIKYVMKYRMDAIEKNVGYLIKIALWYVKGFPNASILRTRICEFKKLEEFLEFSEKL